MNVDTIDWHAQLHIRRWDEAQTRRAQEATGLSDPGPDVFDLLGIPAYDESSVDRNLLTTAGIGRIVTLLNAGTGNLIASTTARVGTGNGAGTAAIGDTDLSAAAGSANRWFQTCTVTTPSNVLTFAATFASADGNYAWNEWGIDIGTATVTSGNTVNAVLLNHKTSIAQGTKASGQTWTATATITLS
jgi:general stress protein CsbA